MDDQDKRPEISRDTIEQLVSEKCHKNSNQKDIEKKGKETG